MFNKFEVGQGSTYPFLTYLLRFCCWYVVRRCDLDLWPLDLERLQRIGCHVIKLCTKLQRNRTFRGRIIVISLRPIWAPSVILGLTGSGFSPWPLGTYTALAC